MYAEEGDAVQELMARLIRCGIPRKTALTICLYFRRKEGIKTLRKYVEEVERECNGTLDEV